MKIFDISGEIFTEMTKEEWLECAFKVDDTTDLEMIVKRILE